MYINWHLFSQDNATNFFTENIRKKLTFYVDLVESQIIMMK